LANSHCGPVKPGLFARDQPEFSLSNFMRVVQKHGSTVRLVASGYVLQYADSHMEYLQHGGSYLQDSWVTMATVDRWAAGTAGKSVVRRVMADFETPPVAPGVLRLRIGSADWIAFSKTLFAISENVLDRTSPKRSPRKSCSTDPYEGGPRCARGERFT